MIYTYVYTYIYTLVNALNQKYFSCSFPFLCQSRRGTPGEWDKNRETSEKKSLLEKEEKRKTKKDLKNYKLKDIGTNQGTQASSNIEIEQNVNR